MNREQSEFRERFSYPAPILPDSMDDATAFFYILNQLIRSTPPEICGTAASNQPGFATELPDSVGFRIRDIAITAVGWIRRIAVAATGTWKE